MYSFDHSQFRFPIYLSLGLILRSCYLVGIFIDFFLEQGTQGRIRERKREYYILSNYIRVPLFSIVHTMVRYLSFFSFFQIIHADAREIEKNLFAFS